MNAQLTAIAGTEADPDFMPDVPTAHTGTSEETPFASRDFLLTCGTNALFAVLEEMGATERHDATKKEHLVAIIMEKTRAMISDESKSS